MDESPRFGTLGRLDCDPIADTLLCHACGKPYRNLAHHARLAHGFTADEYREFAGLNRQTRLMTPGLRARLREVTAPTIARLRAEGKLRRWNEDPEKWHRDKAAAVEVVREGLRLEGREHRRESFAANEELRRERAERRRQRNLAGLDRASPAAIGAGVRRHYQEHPEYRAANAERVRQAGKNYRVTETEARDAVCPRCGRSFRAASHRDKYCPPCRPAAEREYQRAWKQDRRRGTPAANESAR